MLTGDTNKQYCEMVTGTEVSKYPFRFPISPGPYYTVLSPKTRTNRRVFQVLKRPELWQRSIKNPSLEHECLSPSASASPYFELLGAVACQQQWGLSYPSRITRQAGQMLRRAEEAGQKTERENRTRVLLPWIFSSIREAVAMIHKACGCYI
ncbi:hypothetical protein N657DRAFT_200233 [Parathielavia appendiculata]|uniref:Uncharacterized protein n=1 Tax=Parathielavia appendiculata TaxID=2587402 RepID=A0AAN6U690_9PEZI|nr:hypothetical protein N657DRAFT_200233 [Parathielavia appendiculata]